MFLKIRILIAFLYIIYEIWQPLSLLPASQEHRLSKNKVHCSCPLCSAKSKRNGYKISDLKKFEALQYSVEEADVNLNMTPRRGW